MTKEIFKLFFFSLIIGLLLLAGCSNPDFSSQKGTAESVVTDVDKLIGGYVRLRPYICTEARDYNIQAEYDAWKSRYVVDAGGGQLRVQRDAASNFDTVSEGIGYGMLLAVYFNDQNTFDGLYKYCKAHFVSSSVPLMHWKVDRDGNNVSEFADYKVDTTGIPVTGSSAGVGYYHSSTAAMPHGLVYGNLTDGTVWILPPKIDEYAQRAKDFLDGSSNYYPMHKYARDKLSCATDADADIAAALCFAHKRWQTDPYANYNFAEVKYFDEATNMITAMKNNDFTGGYLKAGNLWGNQGIWNPSYFTPAYYLNVFAKHCPDQKEFWTNIYTKIYDEMKKLPDYVNKNYNSRSCMYPDWWDTSASDGTVKKANPAGSDRFYYNYGSSGTGSSLAYPQSAMWAPGTSKSDYTTQGKMSFNSFYDAIRVPWRIMTDYLWDISEYKKAGNIVVPLYYAYASRTTSIVDGYSINCGAWNWDDRDGFNATVGGKNHSTTFISMSACTEMITGNPNAWNEVVNHPETDATFNYYGNTLRLISMLMLSGKFENLYLAPPPSGTTVKIKNRWKNTYLNIEDRLSHCVESGEIDTPQGNFWSSARWIINRNADGYYTFRCEWQPDGYAPFLHQEDYWSSGYTNYLYAEWDSRINGDRPNEGWGTAQWILEPISHPERKDCFRLKNRWTGRYIWIENDKDIVSNARGNNTIRVQNAELPSRTTWDPHSAQWYIEKAR